MRRFIGHLPLVRLAPGADRIPVPGGLVERLSFDAWHAIDGSFGERRSDYERTGPVFFTRVLDGGDDAVDAFRSGADAGSFGRRRLYDCLLLLSTARLPQPDLSTAYLTIDGDDVPEDAPYSAAHLRRIGDCERELVVFGSQHQPIQIDHDISVPLAETAALLEVAGPHLTSLLDALTRTTRPGFTPLNEALHLIAGVESLLVRKGERPTATFARRYAILAATDDPTEYDGLARSLYALRSDIVHGRPLPPADAAYDEFLANVHRPLTCALALRALRWLAAPGGTVDGLRDALDAASADPAGFGALLDVVGDL